MKERAQPIIKALEQFISLNNLTLITLDWFEDRYTQEEDKAGLKIIENDKKAYHMANQKLEEAVSELNKIKH